jgi:hypothetical protein
MSKKNQRNKRIGGPYLAAALFCDSVLEGKDHVASAIRIIDQINVFIHPEAPSDIPSEQQKVPVHVNGLLIFRTGYAPGEYLLSITVESPSGKRQKVLERPISLSLPPNNGVTVHLNTTLMASSGGLFWIHITLGGKRLAHMPLQVTIHRGEGPLELSTPTMGDPSQPSS